jgi:hypothetical protein
MEAAAVAVAGPNMLLAMQVLAAEPCSSAPCKHAAAKK